MRGLRAKVPGTYDDPPFFIMHNNLNEEIRRLLQMEHKNFYGDISYTMPAGMAKSLLDQRKGDDKKMRPQEYLCKIVNEQFGLKGNCISVIIK